MKIITNKLLKQINEAILKPLLLLKITCIKIFNYFCNSTDIIYRGHGNGQIYILN